MFSKFANDTHGHGIHKVCEAHIGQLQIHIKHLHKNLWNKDRCRGPETNYLHSMTCSIIIEHDENVPQSNEPCEC